MNDEKYYKTSFQDKKEKLDGLSASVFMLLLCVLLIGIFVGDYIRPIGRLFKKDDYKIIINGIVRDVRHSPHYDLIQHAWENDGNQLLLKPVGNGVSADRKQYYNWLQEKWIDK